MAPVSQGHPEDRVLPVKKLLYCLPDAKQPLNVLLPGSPSLVRAGYGAISPDGEILQTS